MCSDTSLYFDYNFIVNIGLYVAILAYVVLPQIRL